MLLCFLQFNTWQTQFWRQDIKYLKKLFKATGGESMLHMAICFANFPYHVVLKSAVSVASSPVHIFTISKVKIREFGKIPQNE